MLASGPLNCDWSVSDYFGPSGAENAGVTYVGLSAIASYG